MTVEELMAHLQAFGGKHHVEIQADAECGQLRVKCGVEQVIFRDGVCVLCGDVENYFDESR